MLQNDANSISRKAGESSTDIAMLTVEIYQLRKPAILNLGANSAIVRGVARHAENRDGNVSLHSEQ